MLHTTVNRSGAAGAGRPRRAPGLMVAAAISVALAVLLCGACGGDGSGAPGAAYLQVAASLPPLAHLAERIGGERVEALSVLEPGDSPATYQPSDSEVSAVMRCRVFLRAGVPFEEGGWFRAIEESGLGIVDMRRGIELRSMESGGDHAGHAGHGPGCSHDHGGGDPHIWLAPANLKIMAATIADTLCDVDPEGKDAYREALAGLHADLDALDAEIEELLAPHRGKGLYVFHPAWGYFCDAYGLEQVAVEVEGKEPTDAEITRLQERARGDGVRVIFVQPQFAGGSAEAVARVVGAETRILDPLARDVIAGLRRTAEAVAGSFP